MSKAIPATLMVQATYSRGAIGAYKEDAGLAFIEWLEEIERAASEKAYDRGRLDERHDCKLTEEYLSRSGMDLNTYMGNLRPSNPYRKGKTNE